MADRTDSVRQSVGCDKRNPLRREPVTSEGMGALRAEENVESSDIEADLSYEFERMRDTSIALCRGRNARVERKWVYVLI